MARDHKPIPSLDAARRARFWRRVTRPPTRDACWEWQGSTKGAGYGQVNIRPYGNFSAHRLAWFFAFGEPGEWQIDHLCRNRLCVNPRHMELVTGRVNTLRSTSFAAVNARKTHCPQGHEYTPGNTYTSKRNQRYCKACRRGPLKTEVR